MKLEIKELCKNYGDKQALKGVTLSLTEGIYGFLGPNGAGKSTTMNILTGNIDKTSGEILYDGADISKKSSDFSSKIGYMPQQQAFYPNFTVEQFMFYMAYLRDMKKVEAKEKIDWALDLVSLQDMKKKKIKALSGGMKQRLLLAQAIIADPDILILDEPTAGLDPKQRIAVRNIVSRIAMNKIVILSTHVVPDIEFIAKEIILLSEGNIIRQASPDALIQEIYGKVWEVSKKDFDINSSKFNGELSSITRKGDEVILRLISETIPFEDAKQVLPNLEDVYLYHFGNREEL